MSFTRRRFLTIAAATVGTAALPAHAETLWQGHALGAQASILLRGPHGATGPALQAALAALSRAEAAFSLYDPDSELGRLNHAGHLAPLSPDMRALLAAIDRVHGATDGRFDPTVQSLWTETPGPVGWHLVDRGARAVTLAPGQSLTFNGIAQGAATDAVSAALAAHGFHTTLVNIGELRGRGGPWRVGIDSEDHGRVGTATFSDGAMATSAPGAMRLTDGSSHIVDPQAPRRPALWSSITVEAATATIADAASTAFCLCDAAGIAECLPRLPDVRRVVAVGSDGDISTLTA